MSRLGEAFTERRRFDKLAVTAIGAGTPPDDFPRSYITGGDSVFPGYGGIDGGDSLGD